MEYPTGSQSYDFSAINKNKNKSVRRRNENKTLLNKLVIIGYWYRLFGFPWRTAQLVTVHVMLDCSIVPQNRKNRRNWEQRRTIWRAILVINLLVHLTPDPTRSFDHHSRLFAGIFLFIYIWWFYSKIFNTCLLLPAVSSQINNTFSSSQGFCHHRVRNNWCNYSKSFLAVKSRMRANVRRYLWLFFQPRSCHNKISLQSKNNIKQSLEWM